LTSQSNNPENYNTLEVLENKNEEQTNQTEIKSELFLSTAFQKLENNETI